MHERMIHDNLRFSELCDLDVIDYIHLDIWVLLFFGLSVSDATRFKISSPRVYEPTLT